MAELSELTVQALAGAVDTGADGAEGNLQARGNCCVVEPLHIAEQERRSKRVGELLERELELFGEQGVEEPVEGIGCTRDRLRVLGERLGGAATRAACLVDPVGGEDAKDPAVEAMALVGIKGLVGLQHGLREEIVGIGGVATEAVGIGPEALPVLCGELIKAMLACSLDFLLNPCPWCGRDSHASHSRKTA